MLRIVEDLDDDGEGLVGLLGGFRGLRNEGVEAADGDGLNDHEDDQQHEKNIDERRDVNVGSEFFAAG